MNLRFSNSHPLFISIVLLLLGSPRAIAAGSDSGQLRNVIVILVDDLGWSDLSCMGSGFYQTPNIDRLAAEGMKFTHAYSACTVCSPTRAALLTGRYPARLRVTDWIPGDRPVDRKLSAPEWTMHLPLEEVTIAERLKELGYATASIGKWHLGGAEFGPESHGFDRNVGGDHRGQPASYFSPYKIPGLPDGLAGEFLTDRESLEATKFIEANRSRPFFLYLPHYAVHMPVQAKSNVVDKYTKRIDPKSPHTNAVYAALIESVDDSVGRITDKLRELGLTEKTLIVFTSDNGGLSRVTSNQPLRAGKGSAYEGGVRVPLLMKWPGVTIPGSICSEPVMSIDVFPTVMEIVRAESRPKSPVDGKSLVPLLKQTDEFKREALYWHYPHYHSGGATPYGAVRSGDFKLIEFYEGGDVELYNLKKDPGERDDLANQMPGLVLEMHRKLLQWRELTKAQMPLANPEFRGSSIASGRNIVRSQSDGTILLHARDCTVHGSMVRFEPQPHKNTIGYWTKMDDWVSWNVEVPQPGRYIVEIFQGCGPGNGGSEVNLSLAGQTLTFVVQETKGFQDFIARQIGTIEVDHAGQFQLKVAPKTKPGQAVMDLRWVKLRRE
jgi:arylsulfatase A